ncbi:hypothetical protein LINPERHAP1_LOCUS26772 [Linum perenne]
MTLPSTSSSTGSSTRGNRSSLSSNLRLRSGSNPPANSRNATTKAFNHKGFYSLSITASSSPSHTFKQATSNNI